jgi:hypothetical protein
VKDLLILETLAAHPSDADIARNLMTDRKKGMAQIELRFLVVKGEVETRSREILRQKHIYCDRLVF